MAADKELEKAKQEIENNSDEEWNVDNYVEDIAILLDAQINPQNYSGIKIKVHGHNVRFLKLEKEHQDEHIYQISSREN